MCSCRFYRKGLLETLTQCGNVMFSLYIARVLVGFDSHVDSSSKRDENRPKYKWKRLRGNAPKYPKPLDPGDKNRPAGCGGRRRRPLPNMGGFREKKCFSDPMSASFAP